MPSWQQIAAELPPTANMFHQQGWIMEHVSAGHVSPLEWFPVVTHAEGWKATFRVSNRVLLGDAAGGLLPIVSANTSQRICNAMGGYVCTALLLDHVAEQGVLVDYVREAYANVADLSARNMLENCAKFAAVLRSKGAGGLWTGGKDWIPSVWYADPLAAKLRGGIDTGINYGAHTRAPAGPNGADPARSVSLPQILRVWQPPGGRGKLWHDRRHVDISQKSPHVLHPDAVVISPEGHTATVNVGELAADPQAWRLISHDGPITLRIPLDDKPTPTPPKGDGPSGGGAGLSSSGNAGPALAAAGGMALGLGILQLWNRLG